ncbi:hypothetical protein [Chitinophaga sp. CF418]|uniref:hypothetical protein n=1 Tax=Chitinophaga sp. CF418 TaxID=1855287 RepID=UPI00091D53FB|nr:hypothetical protein [Chitinophaga sp. CF418]SHN46080.1 hypothetical protein SAMN05216311_122109 [Chitinophaga sp. CF418]
MSESRKSLSFPKWLLLLGCIIIAAVFIFNLGAVTGDSSMERIGQFGDAMGGITAPVLNLISSILVFYALKAQVDANNQIQCQIEDQKKTKEVQDESENLHLLYRYLDENINSFNFSSLPKEYLRNKKSLIFNKNLTGGKAFEQLTQQMRCHFHGPQQVLEENQFVSEYFSILTLMDELITKLLICKCANKDILLVLVKHQFLYKIANNIKGNDIDTLVVEYCDDCKCNHGLPENIRNVIKNIQKRLIDVK